MNGLYATHSCDNRLCINPDHIRPGTQKDNMREAIERGRFYRGPKLGVQGERQHLSKLKAHQIPEIYHMQAPQRKIAKMYGVSQGTIKEIKKRRTWWHVDVGICDNLTGPAK